MMLVAAPIKQRNHKYINKSIDQWLDIHFGDTSFNGRVVIGHRKPGGRGVYPMSVRPLDELRPYVKLVHASSRLDYYITANTVSGVNRRKDELFGLQNIVIDIDCHNTNMHPLQIATLVQGFIWRSKRDLWGTGEMPTPNSIVQTGRGVQLWWALVPCYGGSDYGKSLYYHNLIKSTLIDQIENLIDENSELEDLNVDRGTSINPVGFYRLPHTYNTKAKCYSTLEILHSKRYDQRELIKLGGSTKRTRSVSACKQTKYIPMQDSDRTILKNFQSTGVRRVIQLIKLRNLRNNEVGSEMRNYFNFSVYNALRMSFDHTEAMVRLRAYNSGFKQPMTDRELENSISSAKQKEGYKYSNAKLIELLDITSEEQGAIGLFPYVGRAGSKPNNSRDTARKTLREDRDRKIIELTEQGVSQAETARILGIGKNTVNRLIKQLRNQQPVEAVEVTETNSERHHFGSIYVLRDSMVEFGDRILFPSQRVIEREDGLFVLPLEDSS